LAHEERNMRKSPNMLAMASALALSVTAVSLQAAGGGGGGGGGAPSQSAPRYDASAEYQKGVAALKAKEYKKAARAFRRSISVSPRNANTHYLLGLTYMSQENFKKARKPLEKAVKYNAGLIDAQRDLAITYHKLEMAEKAASMLAKMEAQCNGCAASSKLAQAIASVKATMQDSQASYDPMSNVSLASAAGDGFYVSAVALINAGKFDNALAELDRAALSFGPHPDILTYQGFANRKLEKFDLAENYYQRALAVAPDHLGAIEYYGELKVQRGNIKGAKQHLARLEKLCSFGCYEAEELRRWIKAAPSS